MRFKGIVEFFDRKRQFGKVLASSAANEPIFIHRSDISDEKYRYLVKGEVVEFDLVTGPKGPAAVNLARVEPRFSGVVSDFDKKKGHGTIVTDDGFVELFVHFSEIVSEKNFKTLEEGEHVDFVMQKAAGANHRARLVTVDERMPLERFAFLPRWDERLEQLSKIAQEEDWNYQHTSSTHLRPILHSYLHYTFKRVEQEGKVSFATDTATTQKLACFNTGLVTRFYEPVYAVFRENAQKDADARWVLSGFFTESQTPMTLFATHPERANYFEDPTELLYDRRLKLVKNVNHIIEHRLMRFPQRYRDNPMNLPAVLGMAVDQAERRVIANYKTAIPQYNHGRIQLLLPLCLEDPRRADLALVVGREGAVYKGYTVLTLDMAYNNARLLTRPDDEWLIP
jgi:cold shock CspA family protein